MKSAPTFKNLEFIEGPFPSSYKTDYERSLFNTPEHRQLQSKSGWVEYHAVRKDKHLVVGSIYFCVNEKTATSPLRAPFGSFELSERITTEQLYHFISFYEQQLRKQKVSQIEIKNYPELYHPKAHNILSVLLTNHRYKISKAELGACILVEDVSLEVKMDTWEKRKLRQGVKSNLTFRPLPASQLKDIYFFIKRCREERGQSLSMLWEEIAKTANQLKGNVALFGVFQSDVLIAASISIRVSKKILYYFYSAHPKESDPLSPVVFLIHSMYNWCREKKISLLDLGTSALGGKPNFSLIDFKLRMGALPSMKLTLVKKLN